MMNKRVKTAFLTALCLLSSGCATRMTVKAGLAENLKDYYSIYPSVEIDIAAVTEEEAGEMKKLNVDNYFAVGSSKRESLAPYTMTFSEEQTKPQIMKYNVPQWDKWLAKDVKKIAVIVNIPRKTEDGDEGKDSRILIMDMVSGFMHHKELYVEAKPGSIVKIKNEPTDPEVKRKETEKTRMQKEKKADRKMKEAKRERAKKQRAAEKKSVSEKNAARRKIAEEKRAAERPAVEKRVAAKRKAAEARREAERKAAREKKIAEQQKNG